MEEHSFENLLHEVPETVPAVTEVGKENETSGETSVEVSEDQEQVDDSLPDNVIEVGSFTSFVLKCGVNLVLPFINGVMLGFGEIFAHEIGYRYNWAGAVVSPPRRMIAERDEKDLKEGRSVLS
ncbi:DEKNAAC102915 [Brettanomyces naardenensis]|uniref:DEKNAAC102916 n=1 Tax=Brettanomyces naardenensis TaxID=13370 RepID=A0A448YLV5_BRENA|nr:DEKNAAC102915 [Brettanomyces naardenensis]